MKEILDRLRKNRLNEGIYEDYDDEDEGAWDPFQGQKYRVEGTSSSHEFTVTCTSDPEEAIEKWFQFGEVHRGHTAILAKKKVDALEIVKAATPEYLTSLYDKYNCVYKLDHLIDAAAKKVADGHRYFYESEFGDMVYPFDVG